MPNQFRWVHDPHVLPDHLQGEPPSWPQEILDRHGLRVLRPAEALPDPRQSGAELRSTVYRASTLLMPDSLLRGVARGVVAEILDEHGYELIPPPSPADSAVSLRASKNLPRPAVLQAKPGEPPADAWAALQHVRYAVERGRVGREFRHLVEQVSLEHAMVACNWVPAPTSEPHGLHGATMDGPRLGYGRRPVSYIGAKPHRPQVQGGRRPVVVVADTGYGSHEWFGTTTTSRDLPADGFLKTFPITEQLIAAQQTHVSDLVKTQILHDAWEAPVHVDGVARTLAPAVGHGSFIAGIVHQQVPEADVLVIRVVHPDGVAYESDVLLALWTLHARLEEARDGGCADQAFDVVSLSLGFYPESPWDAGAMRITEAVEALTEQGVVVTAAAGNDTTARLFLPAGLTHNGNPRVIGCGALNPNGSVAWFSNAGESVRCLAPGAGIVSTFPDNAKGSVSPHSTVAEDGRAALDADDFSSGFATWSGTSFATPMVASAIVKHLVSLDDISDISVAAMSARADEAIKRLSECSP